MAALRQQHRRVYYSIFYTNRAGGCSRGEIFTRLTFPARATTHSRPISAFLSIRSSRLLPLYNPFHLIHQAHDLFFPQARKNKLSCWRVKTFRAHSRCQEAQPRKGFPARDGNHEGLGIWKI